MTATARTREKRPQDAPAARGAPTGRPAPKKRPEARKTALAGAPAPAGRSGAVARGADAVARGGAALPAHWPALKVETWGIGQLVPYARNARMHSEAQVAQIVASMVEWGWTMPVLVAENGQIIAGHGRVMAAHSMGLTDVPVLVARGWSDTKIRAYTIADNRLAENAAWDRDLLALEMQDLGPLLGEAINLLGFTEGEREMLMTLDLPDLGKELEIGGDARAPESTTLQATCPACGHRFEIVKG